MADRAEISLEELEEYPCLSFEQGDYNSFYFAEEVLSTYDYKRLIKANDRATLLNLMVGLNGYTLCSGIICEELNGFDYYAVKLKSIFPERELPSVLWGRSIWRNCQKRNKQILPDIENIYN